MYVAIWLFWMETQHSASDSYCEAPEGLFFFFFLLNISPLSGEAGSGLSEPNQISKMGLCPI